MTRTALGMLSHSFLRCSHIAVQMERRDRLRKLLAMMGEVEREAALGAQLSCGCSVIRMSTLLAFLYQLLAR